MSEIMSPVEFKYGLLRLADDDDVGLINERVIARNIAAQYIDADEETQRELSRMLRHDLAHNEQDHETDRPVNKQG